MKADDCIPAGAFLERAAPQCQHSRVFPIREKYLHFWCLDCRKELEIRDAGSLALLRPAFMQAAYLLSRGIQVGLNTRKR
jgi:hypothetical protein